MLFVHYLLVWFQLLWHPSLVLGLTGNPHNFKGVNIQLKNGDFLPTVVLYHSKVCQSLVLLTPNGLYGEDKDSEVFGTHLCGSVSITATATLCSQYSHTRVYIAE